METKKFSKFEVAVIKRTAQNVNPMVTKKEKIKTKIDELQAEYDNLSTMQEQYEASIKTMTGGYGTEDIVEKKIEETGSVDKNGNKIKITKYILKYPDTIIPVETPTETSTDKLDDNPLNTVDETLNNSVSASTESPATEV
jgi:hypothetical protein